LNSIKLQNVGKDYDSLCVFEGLNFEIQEGEFVGFLGPSGCGKSTLLSLISGLTTPTHGEVINSFSKESISFVFQEASLMPWQTVAKNVALPLELLHKRKKEIQEKVLKKLKMFHLEEYKNYTPRQLSGGMKMRTSLARALISNPKLLLMDEPFSSLDPFLREKCANDVFDIWKTEKLTTILVTHSISEAAYLCNKIFVLSKRPARIAYVIAIEKEVQQNKTTEFRNSDAFYGICNKIRDVMESISND
jgi:NitT/TauT family transport system ATP-binding protein